MPNALPTHITPYRNSTLDYITEVFLPTWDTLATYGPVALSRMLADKPQGEQGHVSQDLAFKRWGNHFASSSWWNHVKTDVQIKFTLCLFVFACFGVYCFALWVGKVFAVLQSQS